MIRFAPYFRCGPAGWEGVRAMTSHRSFEVTARISLNLTELRLLRCLAARAGAPGVAVRASTSELRRELGLSPSTIYRSCLSLQDKLLIRISHHEREDRSRDANNYLVTSLGDGVLGQDGFLYPVRGARDVPRRR